VVTINRVINREFSVWTHVLLHLVVRHGGCSVR